VAGYKRESDVVDGTPEKRLFLSIISDYDLKTGLCELVDNAFDVWVSNGKPSGLIIDVRLDPDRQLISVIDNAGGVPEDKLRRLVAPGVTGNPADKDLIGIFGVGGKRAGVALGEQVDIRTRFKKQGTFLVEITNLWLDSPDWHLQSYRVADIDPGSTIVEISKLRQTFTAADVEFTRQHFGETYDRFLDGNCTLRLNGREIQGISFEQWSYPPNFQPQSAEFTISPAPDRKLAVNITAGLIGDRDKEGDNYGVYVYCNNRLIVKELRTRDVGYVTGEAGVPHPDASLCRVIVNFQGSPELMPWNSSKNYANFSHPAFTDVRRTLIRLNSHFSTLSRRLKNEWPTAVFEYKRGTINTIDADEVLSGKKLVLPTLPRASKPSRLEELRAKNRKIMSDKPWTIGLVEAMGVIDIVSRQKLDTKNRVALILLDSNFEIALKEFIVNNPAIFNPMTYNDAKIATLFKSRHAVIKEIKPHVPALDPKLLGKVNHYYGLRNKLIHERATVGITDNQVKDYRKTIERVLGKLFKLKFPKDSAA
jgi:Histidine kinase-, DNA gyrase B-, and HSP90-like ATPase